MQVEKELAELAPEKATILTIGVFDGVHLGHKYLISQLIKHAREQNLLSGVVTFRQHPQELMSPQTTLPFLTDLNQRIDLIKNEGVDRVFVLSFTPELARLTASEFVSLLKNHFKMRGLVLGHDFALGRNREGDENMLRKLGKEMGFTVNVVRAKLVDGELASSTAIRKALAAGDMKRVHRLIGRNFGLSGHVVSGAHRGTRLGFPTANIQVNPSQALPPDGVYATWSYIDGQTYPSMTNIGKRPTFDNNERTVEVFVLDYQSDLYGREMSIDLIDRVRDEKKFNTAEELQEQIAADIKLGRTILNRHQVKV